MARAISIALGNKLTVCHLAGFAAQAGLVLISTSVSQRGLAIARKMQLAIMMANTTRPNHGFSTTTMTAFRIGFCLASRQKAKSLCKACKKHKCQSDGQHHPAKTWVLQHHNDTMVSCLASRQKRSPFATPARRTNVNLMVSTTQPKHDLSALR